MKVEQKISVHNKFEVEVRDKDTGEVKQTAVGYNVILDRFFTAILTSTQSSHNLLYYIAFGQGTGTPSASDTGLFSLIDAKSATVVETVYAYPTSHITKRVILDADSYNGRTITEVGFRGYSYLPSYTEVYSSHAMLQDSEGRQIAINKTDTDVVYINATFYCTYTPGGFGNNGIYPEPASNDLVKWVFGNAFTSYSDYISLRTWHRALEHSSDLNRYYSFNKSYRVYSYNTIVGLAVGDVASKTFTLEAASVLSGEGGTQTIKTLGFPGIGAFTFPDASILDRYRIQNKTIATGDGTTKEYSLGAPFIKRNSVHIYVDDVEKTEGTDFTINYDSNCTDNIGNYHTSRMSLLYDRDHVVFGDETTRSKIGNTMYDPICMAQSLGASSALPNFCYVKEATPIWIDFSEAKNCNRLVFKGFTLPSGREDSMVIECSSDNETWNAVPYVRAGQTYKFDDTSARYWRVYISGYTWVYYFNVTSTVDGVGSIGATFFLGETHTALTFTNAPAQDSIITATYDLEIPYKTENNLIRMTVVISLNRD